MFPKLVDHGLYGYEASGYWLDIGTPSRYLQATYDILEGKVTTQIGTRLQRTPGCGCCRGRRGGRIAAPGPDRRRAARSPRTRASAAGSCSAAASRSAQERRVEGSVLLDGVSVGARTQIRGAIIEPGRGDRRALHIDGGVVLGEGCGSATTIILTAGARVFPGVVTSRRSDQVLSTGRTLSRDAVAEVDVTGQFDEVLGLPDHLRDALWRVESANLKPHDSPGGLVIAGIGGSSVGGALARAALGDGASRPIVLARDYGLPGWTTPDTTVLCASYSGNTEETLAAYDAAQALGATTIVVTTGGKLAEQARADGVPVIPLPAASSRAPRSATRWSSRSRWRACAAPVRASTPRSMWPPSTRRPGGGVGPDSDEDSLAKTLARGLHGTIPQIAGAALTAPIAYRWKTQINENAKAPAFAAELPELDHNELVGWDGARDFGPFSAVFLDDSDLHPRVRQRIELTRGLIASRGGATFRSRRSARRDSSG